MRRHQSNHNNKLKTEGRKALGDGECRLCSAVNRTIFIIEWRLFCSDDEV